MINEINHVLISERHGFESRRSLNSYRVLFYREESLPKDSVLLFLCYSLNQP